MASGGPCENNHGVKLVVVAAFSACVATETPVERCWRNEVKAALSFPSVCGVGALLNENFAHGRTWFEIPRRVHTRCIQHP